MAEGVGLFELSPFTKIDVQGPDALALLQYLCANDIDHEVGRAVYTQMLNARGGIKHDITVTRYGDTHFRVISGAATRRRTSPGTSGTPQIAGSTPSSRMSRPRRPCLRSWGLVHARCCRTCLTPSVGRGVCIFDVPSHRYRHGGGSRHAGWLSVRRLN